MTDRPITAAVLDRLLESLDSAPVECDGMCRLVATRLAQAGIPYQGMLGQLLVAGRAVSPHYWIEVGIYRVDYRARMWLGTDPEIPHGVFPLDGRPSAQYTGIRVQIDPLPPSVYEILIMPPLGIGPPVAR
ncbi:MULTISPECIES: hypothetical protein [unclassified Pseudomonas]|jgi:hypothetical protein|uniref:hypothetical protein n=1 Tax=unclassified Pseudomonas TaxID=196821 RepID=UPI0008D66E74|nr:MULTISPECIES: hypothetical protein [unclassified Pseudomonas]OHC62148.1 MAG: hypothetical protein A3J25_03750 [Pseudomonadales bacterium RIFCSPLOWO2_02_FULL_63_210]PMZ85932.1 hypothetical protein C1X61_25290 [Pseudomonas sp. FW215-T2]PNB39531.1 hypothetical protein C1X63_03505 [Pseudomonas sp. FW305-131]